MSAMTGIPSPLWAENQRLQAVNAELRARVAELERESAAVHTAYDLYCAGAEMCSDTPLSFDGYLAMLAGEAPRP